MDAQFAVQGRQVTVRTSGEGGPAVFLHCLEDDGRGVWEECLRLGCTDFSLVTVSCLNWSDDLSPWECPPLTRSDAPCGGKAEAQLALLEEQIVPAALECLPHPPAYLALAGYSLAGLFAVWALFQTDRFARAACASGSLWFPGFLEYAARTPFAGQPACVYLSLGSQEHKTPNRLLRTVRDCTGAFSELLDERGVPMTWEKNRGNHFKDVALRTAKGIAWILEYDAAADGAAADGAPAGGVAAGGAARGEMPL